MVRSIGKFEFSAIDLGIGRPLNCASVTSGQCYGCVEKYRKKYDTGNHEHCGFHVVAGLTFALKFKRKLIFKR